MPSSIAMIHYAGPPGVGGVETTIAAHTQLLVQAGHTVRWIMGSGSCSLAGVEVVLDPTLSARDPRVEAVQQELARGQRGPTFEDLVAEIMMTLVVALRQMDLLIVHNVHTLQKNVALTTALYRLHMGSQLPRMVAWCHDLAWCDPLYATSLHAGFPWELLATAWAGVQYVTVSEAQQEALCDLMGLSRTQVSVIPPGIDVQEALKLEPATLELIQICDLLPANPLLLLPARITRRKNIELAIAITAAMRTQGAAPKLVITGPPGPHNATNQAYLQELQALQHQSAGDAICFLCRVYRTADGMPHPVTTAMMADLYRLADALLFPSRLEGFGLPILEAGLAGIPIFCSQLRPFQAIAADAATYFDPQDQPERIAHQIIQALAQDRRVWLRHQVRTVWSWPAIFRQHIEPLLTALSD